MSFRSVSVLLASATLAASAAAATSWDLASDYAEDTNPNGKRLSDAAPKLARRTGADGVG